MAKTANPLIQIAKKLETLKTKSEKLAQAISDLSVIVAAESSKAQAPAQKKPISKRAAASTESKKRGRPRAVSIDDTVISRSTARTPKPRGRKK